MNVPFSTSNMLSSTLPFKEKDNQALNPKERCEPFNNLTTLSSNNCKIGSKKWITS